MKIMLIEILLTIAIGLLGIMIRNQMKLNSRVAKLEQRLKDDERFLKLKEVMKDE